jgi:hypothetical protein
MLHFGLLCAVFTCALRMFAFAGHVCMRKKDFLRYDFTGTITDISLCRSEINQHVLVLAQGNGVLVDEGGHIQERLSFNPCSDTRAVQIGDTFCLIYCPDGGFSRVWIMGLDGKEIWRYRSSNRVTARYPGPKILLGDFALRLQLRPSHLHGEDHTPEVRGALPGSIPACASRAGC